MRAEEKSEFVADSTMARIRETPLGMCGNDETFKNTPSELSPKAQEKLGIVSCLLKFSDEHFHRVGGTQSGEGFSHQYDFLIFGWI